MRATGSCLRFSQVRLGYLTERINFCTKLAETPRLFLLSPVVHIAILQTLLIVMYSVLYTAPATTTLPTYAHYLPLSSEEFSRLRLSNMGRHPAAGLGRVSPLPPKLSVRTVP